MRQLLRAHEYWRMKRLAVDLVILNERATSYVQDLQGTLETLVRDEPVEPRARWPSRATAACSSCAATCSPRGPRRCSRRPPAPCCSAARAASPSRSSASSGPTGAAAADDAPTVAGQPVRDAPSPASGAGVLQRAGGFAEDGREYVTVLGAGPVDAGAVDQRHRQPVVRVPGVGVRRRATRGPRTAARTSSRPGRTTPSPTPRRSDLRARRGDRRRSGARRRCRSGGTGRPTSPATARATAASSTCARASRSTSSQFVPLDDPVKISRPHDREPVRALAAPVRHGLRRVGAGHVARRRARRTSSPSWTRRRGRCWRATPGTPSSPGGSPSSTSAGGRPRGPAIGPSSSAATAVPTVPRRSTRGHRLRGAVGAGLDPCAALQTSFELAAGAAHEIVVLLGAGRRRRDGRARSSDAVATTDHARRSTAVASTGTTRWARSRCGRPTARWTSCSTAGCSTRRSPAGSGRGRRFYQAGGAYGFRDQLQDVMALVTAEPRAGPRAPPARRGPPVRRRRRPALVAPAVGRGVRTRISDDRLWLPYAVAPIPRGHGRRGGARRDGAVPGRAGARPGETDAYFQPDESPTDGDAVRALRARTRPQPRGRRPRPAADRVAATGTTA